MNLTRRLERIEKILLPNKTRIPPGEEFMLIIPDKNELQVSKEKKESLIRERLEKLNREYGPGISEGDLYVFEIEYVKAKGAPIETTT